MAEASQLRVLPAELRNRIFEYALTAPEDLRYCMPVEGASKPTFRVSATETDEAVTSHPFNQLKFVSRQFYAETAGIEIRLNTISFALQNGSAMSPAEHLTEFLQSMSPKARSWLRKVIVRDDNPQYRHHSTIVLQDTAETISKLAEICERLPSVTLYYVLSKWTFSEEVTTSEMLSFLRNGIMCASALKGQELTDMLGERSLIHFTARYWIHRLDDWKGNVDVRSLRSSNVKFVPNMASKGSAVISSLDRYLEHFLLKWENRAEQMVTLLKRWTDEGI
ncbi:hypothetical protein CC86DRAFT_75168 [Ophiobolus disseminans]|uniref:F-box domain-containing protein n=1 Tax=Ophiobolus disseminans TaxID=1469910 RepID=A0A6A6ZQ92_9PLEO|nr:hypothetical protein CC86DRAFT_75168 [Ophiobolus disseminans]